MRKEFLNAKLPAPVFSVHRGEFKVVMKNSYNSGDLTVADSVLEYCTVPRTRAQITEFVGKSQNYVMSQIVNPLVKSGRLKLTMPDKPKSAKQKYLSY